MGKPASSEGRKEQNVKQPDIPGILDKFWEHAESITCKKEWFSAVHGARPLGCGNPGGPALIRWRHYDSARFVKIEHHAAWNHRVRARLMRMQLQWGRERPNLDTSTSLFVHRPNAKNLHELSCLEVGTSLWMGSVLCQHV